MNKDKIQEYALELVKLSIQKHKENSLGKEKMSTFIKNNLMTEIPQNEYDLLLHYYNKYLAQAGYEIKQDINNFDVINYNSNEYQKYYKNINS